MEDRNVYVENYLRFMQSVNTGSKHTLDAYTRDIFEFLAFLDAESIARLNDVDRFVVNNYIMSLREKQTRNGSLKNSTIARKLSTLRSFYRYLNQYSDVTNNPFIYIKTPKKAKKIPEFLFYNEMETLLDSFDLSKKEEVRNRLLVEMMYACGLRLSELCNLKINDIYFSQGYLLVVGKGDKERIVPFYPMLGKNIKTY